MKKRNKLAYFLMTAGVLCILAAIALVVYNNIENQRAEYASVEIIKQISSGVEEKGTDNNSKKTEVITVDGVDYYGYIIIPKFNLNLPVAANWNFDQMLISPCTYSGTPGNDNWVIAAHNYKKHFSKIKNLLPGDTVYFIDANGEQTEYMVILPEILDPTQVEEMKSSDYNLSLFTCTYTGESRFTLRCNKINL